jgi:hypothetical protein
VTYLLEAVAVAIGLAGVAASFAALAAARRKEFGMLRHLGLTRRQIGWMLAQEGALAAGVGVLAGLLAGGAIGLVLIEVVNRQSFHWSMDVHVPWLSLLVFGAALVAWRPLARCSPGARRCARTQCWRCGRTGDGAASFPVGGGPRGGLAFRGGGGFCAGAAGPAAGLPADHGAHRISAPSGGMPPAG